MGNADLAHVYRMDPPVGNPLTGTWKVTRVALPRPLPKEISGGVYSRWRYVPSIRKFAYVSTTTEKVALWSPADSGVLPAVAFRKGVAQRVSLASKVPRGDRYSGGYFDRTTGYKSYLDNLPGRSLVRRTDPGALL